MSQVSQNNKEIVFLMLKLWSILLVLIDEDLRIVPCTSATLFIKNSAEWDPSC